MDIVIMASLPVGFIAGWLGSQVGGGGLIVVPFLLFMGLSPQQAVATHRLGAYIGHISSLFQYLKTKKVVWSIIPGLIILKTLGGILGAKILLNIPSDHLEIIIAIALLLPLPLIFSKHVGLKPIKRTNKLKGLGWLLLALLSIWAGFFSAGTGILELYLITYFFGLSLLEFNATKRIPSLFSGAAVLIVFFMADAIHWTIGLPLSIGYLLGANIGSKLAIKKGNPWIRTLLIGYILISSTKLLFF